MTDGNEYKGSAAWRDMVIQLTADGATEQSLEYLTYLKDYAIYHSALGEPIMPPGKNVWISNNGTTTAVEADVLSFTDDTFTICGITFSGDAWDFSNAGQGGGGSSLPSYDASDKGKVLTIAEDAEHTVTETIVPEQSVTIEDSPLNIIANPGDFLNLTVGDSVILTVDGASFPTTVTTQNGNKLVEATNNGTSYSMYHLSGQTVTASCWNNDGIITGTYTMSLTTSVPAVAPAWETPSGGGGVKSRLSAQPLLRGKAQRSILLWTVQRSTMTQQRLLSLPILL